MGVGPDRLAVGDPDRQHQEDDRRADGQGVRQARQAGQHQDCQHRLRAVCDRGQRVGRQHGQCHELAHSLHCDGADVQRRAEEQPVHRLAGPRRRSRLRLRRTRGLDRGQLPVAARNGHEPGKPGRAELAGRGVLAEGRVDRQRFPPRSRLIGYPVPLAPDLPQDGQLARVERGNYRVRPRRARVVLPAGVLPVGVLNVGGTALAARGPWQRDYGSLRPVIRCPAALRRRCRPGVIASHRPYLRSLARGLFRSLDDLPGPAVRTRLLTDSRRRAA